MDPLRRMFDHRPIVCKGWILLLVLLLCSCFSREGLEPGDKAPNFTVKTLDGKPFRFDPPFNETQVIYFWGAWCRYCEDNFQQMNALYAKWEKQSESPRFVAVNAGQPQKRIQKFVNRMEPSFPIYIDRDIKVARRFGVRGLPTYFITDKQGIIRDIIIGWANEETLLGKISEIE
jgi:peroxiredoxin